MNYLLPSKIYLNAFITRSYMGCNEKTALEVYFKKIKVMWDKKKVLIIEVEQIRLGFLMIY
jgi:hypothetical protein